jgi:hypothetical protein
VGSADHNGRPGLGDVARKHLSGPDGRLVDPLVEEHGPSGGEGPRANDEEDHLRMGVGLVMETPAQNEVTWPPSTSIASSWRALVMNTPGVDVASRKNRISSAACAS